jgi:3-deoxy-D-manno-octulosonate 8-phosphate phosphatase (KDO 8-P phosphatase)
MKNINLTIDSIDLIALDFDGVLTNNLVHLDKNGLEWVTCNRADGLAFDMLKILKKPVLIVSTEKNSVVSARAKKLNIPVYQGVNNKVEALKKIIKTEGYKASRIIFVGNDLNDYHAMKFCGFSACPSDSHHDIKNIADLVLNSKGGDGVLRELLEDVMSLDFLNIMNDYY